MKKKLIVSEKFWLRVKNLAVREKILIVSEKKLIVSEKFWLRVKKFSCERKNFDCD